MAVSMPEAAAVIAPTKVQTMLAGAAGGSLGFLINYGLYLVFGENYPKEPTTFALFAAGAFVGMAVSDSFGGRAFRAIAWSASVLLTLTLMLVVLVLASPR